MADYLKELTMLLRIAAVDLDEAANEPADYGKARHKLIVIRSILGQLEERLG